MRTDEFDYTLPEEAIAQSAIEPRDDSRLLVLEGLVDRRFSDLPDVLRSGDLLVVNRTRVRAARLVGQRRPGGGKTEILLTQRVDPRRWQALLRPAAKLHAGSVVDCATLTATLLTDPVDGVATVNVESPGDVEEAIEQSGTIPLPPYFKGTLEDPERYQTIFAQAVGSAAAPTAALHFTRDLLDALALAGIGIAEVELEVGLDTFRPMTTERVESHRMHTERIHVDGNVVQAVEATRAGGGRIVAVGTTVVRSLESASPTKGVLEEFEGPTSLFIRPGYETRIVDALVTNFHAPRTTLLVMLAALVGDRWRTAYEHALGNGYRFLSFGDAMYLEVGR
ncbi:MAG: tRNA preQ1(34) S-adenosylmethionine ribosyltransferase-isomerase QueA [Actinomycetia bacterium]|nr:tRNA preQ1(34) S-adenosylmethionine ribosyltransferase-isomerase QueA [Actinomycetes bacterium]